MHWSLTELRSHPFRLASLVIGSAVTCGAVQYLATAPESAAQDIPTTLPSESPSVVQSHSHKPSHTPVTPIIVYRTLKPSPTRSTVKPSPSHSPTPKHSATAKPTPSKSKTSTPTPSDDGSPTSDTNE